MNNFHLRIYAQTAIILLMLGTPKNLLAQSSPEQAGPSKVPVTILVTLDNAPCPNARVEIKPIHFVADWPEEKHHRTVTTGSKGLVTIELSPGDYRAVAHDPGQTREPDDRWFSIQPGQRLPQMVHLNLLYWDCSKVLCTL